MNSRLPRHLRKANLSLRGIALAALLLIANTAHSATIRVVSLDLNLVKAPAAQVAKLIEPQNPDVILLQGVQDWSACQALVEALDPSKFRVAACSAFETEVGTSPCQLAVISRLPASYAWHERVGLDVPANGYTFAVLESAAGRFGIFSARFAGKEAASVAQKIAGQTTAASKWLPARRPNVFFVGFAHAGTNLPDATVTGALSKAGLELVQRLQDGQIAFVQPSAAAAPVVRTNLSMFVVELDPAAKAPVQPPPVARKEAPATAEKSPSTKPAQSVSNAPPIAPAQTSTNKPPSQPAVVPPATTNGVQPAKPIDAAESKKSSAAASRPQLQKAASSATTPSGSGAAMIWWICGGVALFLIGFGLWMYRRQRPRRTPGLLTQGREGLPPYPYPAIAPVASVTTTVSAEGTVTTRTESTPLVHEPAGQADTGAPAGMVNWLKQEFVRRLVNDRGELLDAQSGAARQVRGAEERLASIEEKIARQEQVYSAKIEELTGELGAAREENRELIRMRIAQVRSDLEAARRRIMNSQADR